MKKQADINQNQTNHDTDNNNNNNNNNNNDDIPTNATDYSESIHSNRSNNSSILSLHERDEALLFVFRSIDRGGEKKINFADLEALRGSKGLDRAQLRRIFEKADINGSGYISEQEFLERVSKSRFFHDAQQLFKKIDKDRSGVITREEAMEHLEALGSKRSQEVVSAMMRGGDRNKDDRISFKEFLFFLTKAEHYFPILHALASTGGEAKYGLPTLPSHDNLNDVAVDIVNFDDVAGVSREFSTEKVLRTLFCGACAGMIAKTAVAPFMRVKLLFQVTDRLFTVKKALSLTKDILRNEGIFALWRGNSAVLARTLPYVSIHFLAHDLAEDRLRTYPGENLSMPRKFAAGAFAGVSGTVCTYPLDLIRARLAVGPKFTWSNIVHSVYSERGIMGFYSGLSVTLVGIVPYTGIAWTIKGKLNEYIKEQKHRKLNAGEKLFCGAFAGLVAQGLTYPLEMVRRRMQMPYSTHLGNSDVSQTVRTLVRKEGLGGLFKGFSLNVLKGPVAIGISFATFDTLKEMFGISGA